MGLRMWYLGMIRFLSRMSEFFMTGKNKTQYMSSAPCILVNAKQGDTTGIRTFRHKSLNNLINS